MTVYRTRGSIVRPDPTFGELVTGLSRQSFVVGLDPSLTAYGVTIMDVRTPENWATWVVRVDDRGVARLRKIRQTIMTLLSGLSLSGIAMEGYSFGSSKSQAHKAGELGGVIKMALSDAMLPDPVLVPPTSLKKFATGSGNAKKSEMLLQVFKRWDVEFDDDNAADAYALARVARALAFGDATALPKFQQDVLAKVGPDEG